MIVIRPIGMDDAAAFLELQTALDEETQFMMLEPGERSQDVSEMRERLRGLLARPNQVILALDAGGTLVGYVSASGGAYRRNRASAQVVAGIRQAHAGQGWGARLFAALVEWARGAGIHRLELTVMAHNERALHLYQKMGFEIEGRMKDNLCVAGQYVDEYLMSRIL